MKKQRISDIIGNLSGTIIEEATAFQKPEISKHKVPIKRIAACAACFIFIIGLALLIPQFIKDKPKTDGNIVSIGGVMREYNRQTTVSISNTAIVWPWKYQKIYNQYRNIKYNGKDYYVHSVRTVDKSHIGESLGIANAVGYDETDNGKTYTKQFEIFRIKNIKTDFLIAVCMNNGYYICKCGEFNPPATLDKFINDFNLSKNLELRFFSDYKSYDEKGFYSTADNDLIWEKLTECKNGELFPDKEFKWSLANREYISFTVTSDPLGAYKQALYVTKDGYLATNLFGWQYIYYIGEDTANKVINCAKQNAVKAKQEPYNYSVVGTVTKIAEDYFLIDDSVLCADKNDGMVFKVNAEDMDIWRFIDSKTVKVGDIIVVSFFEKIDVKNGNLINDAFDINTSVKISNDGTAEILY